MTTPTRRAPGNVTQASWPSMFPPDIGPVVSAIVGGAPFSRSVTPLPTSRTAVSFPLVNDLEGAAWVPELGQIPVLGLDAGEYEVGISKLAGTILVSLESVNDTDYPVTAQVEQTLEDTFSAKLDADLIGGAGPYPVPTGVLAVAPETTGADWLAAAIKAKAEIAARGGTASHIALDPAIIGAIEDERDEIGRQLYPDAATVFAALETVSAVSATQPIVYDSSRLWLAVNRDFAVDRSEQVSEAWNRYALSLRIVGRLAICVPMPVKSCRKLKVEPATASAGTHAESAKRTARS